MKKNLLLIFGLVFFTAEVHAGLKYVGHATVKRYYPVGGATYLMLDVAHVNPAGCKSAVYYASTKAAVLEHDEYRKLILTAKASNQKIGVYIWDDKCLGSYPQIYSIFIQ